LGHAQVEICLDLQGKISQGLSNGQGLLPVCDSPIMLAYRDAMDAHMAGDLPEPLSIVQSL
jgi:hypothetical protein